MLSSQQLLEDLTDEQRQAVTHVDGPLLIIAGAGSGKTRVITRRVAYLMSLGIPPASILAITFTNKAAGEMKTRVSSLLARPLRDFGRLDQPWSIICTFHSLGLRILKHYAPRLGLAPNFSIFDTSDQERLIKEAIKTADLDPARFTPGAVHHAISAAKNKLISASAYAAGAGDFSARNIARIYANYEKLLATNNALDFDDLLMRVAFALRDQPEILAELQERFQYILIDEYQDTNHAQYVVAHALALSHRNLCVVGDPDQSIYAWRGADIQNILDFEKDYPDARVVKLERNYRSTQTILAIASKIIAHNRQRKDKRLFTENPVGEQARLFLCGDEHEEALTIAQHFAELNSKGRPWSQMAVFYRINAISRVIEDAFRRSGIPYRVARGVDFYHRKEIKDTLAYLRVIANPSDELSLTRILNVPPRGIGDTSVARMQAHALAKGWNLWQTLQNIDQIPGATARTINAVRGFVQLVQRWRKRAGVEEGRGGTGEWGNGGMGEWEMGRGGEGERGREEDKETRGQEDKETSDAANCQLPTGNWQLATFSIENQKSKIENPLASLLEDVVKSSGLEAYLRKSGSAELEELANVGELISSAAQFDEENPEGTLADYLNQISLVSDVDNLKDNGGAVTLMTLHAAKGLEFPVVSIVAMEEGALPHARVMEHPEQLEEERRLCFVGITRAQELLILSRAAHRTIRGLRERTAASRFLAEIPPETLAITDTSGSAWDLPDTRSRQADLEGARQAAQFRRGQMVRHPTFGIGRLIDLSDMGQHTRAVVEFSKAGRKTLILQYARLEPVG